MAGLARGKIVVEIQVKSSLCRLVLMERYWSEMIMETLHGLVYLETELSGGVLTVSSSQTNIESVINSSLVVGRDTDNQIKFSTDNQMIFRVNGSR